MAESTSDSTTEVVRATPPSASDTVNDGVETDTVESKKDRKSHTPSSLSRTQLPPSATPEERASLEKLKQKMEFVDDASQNSPTNSPPKSPQLPSNDNSPVEVKKGLEGNENGDMSEGEIDTSASMSHVLSRLDQVRHYLEEANGLYKAFEAQESLTSADQVQMLKLANLIKHFKEQELGYLTLLQRIMNFEQDGDGESGEEETTTAELNTTRDTLASSLHSDDDQQAPAWSSSAPTLPTVRTANLNNSLSLQSELDRSRNETNENDMSQEEELAVLKEQHALLTRLLHQQKELQQLEARQANLRALKQEAETTLAAARIEMQQANSQVQQPRSLVDYDHTSSASESSQSNDEEPQVVELETGMAEMSMEENTGPHSLAALVDEEAEKAALMAKLDDLEGRKARIDRLLMQLRSLQSTESEAATAAGAAPMGTMPPAVATVPSDDWLATIDDPLLRERIRQLQIRGRNDQQRQLQQQEAKDREVYEIPEAVQQDHGTSEVVDVTREKDLEEKMRKLEEAREQLKRLQGAIASYQDMMSEDTGQDHVPANQIEDDDDDDELNKSLVTDYQTRLAGLRQEVNELLQQREELLDTQRMMHDLRETTSASAASAAAAATHKRPTATGGYPPPTAAMAATAGGGSNVGGQLSVELMRQKQLYDELVKKTQLLHELQGSTTRGAVGSEHDTYSVTSSMRGVSTVEGGGDMTMATWGGSTAQSVNSNEGDSDEGEYDNNFEGDTTLQHTGDSAALEESEHATYNVDDVQFRVDRHTPRRRVLTPDSGMVNSSGKKIKLDAQPRATKFTEPDPTSKYSNPEFVRPMSPRRKYRQSEHEMELQQQLVASSNMCNDLLRSQLQLVDVLTYRLNTQMPAYPLGLMQYYDNYHQQLVQYHAYLHDVYQRTQQSFSQQQQENDQGATEQPLDSAMPGQAAPAPPPVGTFAANGQGVNMASGYPFAEGSSSSLYPNPSQYPPSFPGIQSNNTSFNLPNQSFNIPPPPAPVHNVHVSPYPFDPRFAFYNSPFLPRAAGITPQHSYPWSPLRAYTSPMRPFEVPPPFRGSPVFHFGRTPPYGPGMEPQFNVQTHTTQPVTVYPPQSPSGITAASAQAVAPSTPSARSVSTLQQPQDLNGQQDQGGLLESGPLFSEAMPASNANMFHTVASGHPTTASVTFGVPTIATMTQKDSKPSASATSRPAELTAAYVKSTQTKLEEADSESSMPCSLPDDLANRYARADAMGTVSGPTGAAAAATAAANMNEDLEEEFSLFEALRDSIYSEVATLISNNESRPHFLIELFRELQLLKTDYLRQRALYSIQDLVTRFLTEENLAEEAANPYLHWVESGTDQTPSDSLVTSDDELNKGKTPQAGAHDYSEPAESATTLSTPPVEPFASDNLGDTVIHLDISKSRSNDNAATQKPMEQGLPTNTDDTSDSSKSDAFSTENISTQALDQQIKNIMIEVIPLLKNHLQSPCSTEFLVSIQQFIMNLALKEEDQQMEYVQVFTAQLSETLTKTLAKYNGKLLKDCGEELLIDVSEVLFNEMAFLKLMEDVANHPDADILGLPLAQVVETKSPEKSSCSTAVLQNLASTAMKQLHLEEEELGKDRDDDLANQCEFPVAQELSTVVEAEVSGDALQPSASDTQHGSESLAVEGKPQGEEPTQTTTNTEEDTSKSNSTIEPAAEPTESVANDDKPSPTGNDNNSQVQNDPADVQTESKATHPVNNENTDPVSDTNTTNLDQAALKTKMEEEQKTTTGLAGVLASISTDTALAGDGDSIKEPTETEP